MDQFLKLFHCRNRPLFTKITDSKACQQYKFITVNFGSMQWHKSSLRTAKNCCHSVVSYHGKTQQLSKKGDKSAAIHCRLRINMANCLLRLAVLSDTIHTILSIFPCTAFYIIHNNRLNDENSVLERLGMFQFSSMFK